MHLSTTTQYLNGYVNIQINPASIDDFVEIPIERGAIGLMVVNGLFKEIGLSESCYLLYTARRWLSSDGILRMDGFGNLGLTFPTILLRLLYACGFLAAPSPSSHPESGNSIDAYKYADEMPEHLLVQKVHRILTVLAPHDGCYAATFMQYVNRRAARC